MQVEMEVSRKWRGTIHLHDFLQSCRSRRLWEVPELTLTTHRSKFTNSKPKHVTHVLRLHLSLQSPVLNVLLLNDGHA